MKIAIMQPYFMPYPGYFRLFHATDLFIIYDCVQFPRRGFVHRNRLNNANQKPGFLTLPLQKKPIDTLIKDLEFDKDSEILLKERCLKFPVLKKLLSAKESSLSQGLFDLSIQPVDYLTRLLKLICDHLHISFNVIRSSTLNLPASLKGQDRILAITKHFKATEYINSPGGAALYQSKLFVQHNIQLKFLKPYKEKNLSILHYLHFETSKALRKNIVENIGYQS